MPMVRDSRIVSPAWTLLLACRQQRVQELNHNLAKLEKLDNLGLVAKSLPIVGQWQLLLLGSTPFVVEDGRVAKQESDPIFFTCKEPPSTRAVAAVWSRGGTDELS